MARTAVIVCSIPGISTITAFSLLVEIPELGILQSKQIASLAGLAPYSRDSGQWNGKGGRESVSSERDAMSVPNEMISWL